MSTGVHISAVRPAPAPAPSHAAPANEAASKPFGTALDRASKKAASQKPAKADRPAPAVKAAKPAKPAAPATPAAKKPAARLPADTSDHQEEEKDQESESQTAEAEQAHDDLPADPTSEPARPRVKDTGRNPQSSAHDADAQSNTLQSQQAALAPVKAVSADAQGKKQDQSSDESTSADSADQSGINPAIQSGDNSSALAHTASEPATAGEKNAEQAAASPTGLTRLPKAGVQSVNGTGSASSADDADDATSAQADADAAAETDTTADPAVAATNVAKTAAAPVGQTLANGVQHVAGNTFADTLASAQGQSSPSAVDGAKLAHAAPAPLTPEAEFAQDNNNTIVSNIHSQLLPNGGTMQLQLDPAELGKMNVSVHIKDGVMSATFETSNENASRVLSHSLGQLKASLEGAGITVGGLHVQQAPRGSATSSQQNGQQQGKGSSGDSSNQSQQQEQQRREMLRQMWRRLNGGKDPLDLVA